MGLCEGGPFLRNGRRLSEKVPYHPFLEAERTIAGRFWTTGGKSGLHRTR